MKLSDQEYAKVKNDMIRLRDNLSQAVIELIITHPKPLNDAQRKLIAECCGDMYRIREEVGHYLWRKDETVEPSQADQA